MTNAKMEMDWGALLKLADEVKSDDGPGSANWQADGSETQQINAKVMRALRENDGTIPGELSSVPCLILTTTGAKTGKKRSVPLFCLAVDNCLVIIGSMGGAERNPPWFYNLVKTPNVSVEKGGETFRAQAVVTEGAERDHFFKKFCEAYPIFSEYQAGVSRVIPIVELQRI